MQITIIQNQFGNHQLSNHPNVKLPLFYSHGQSVDSVKNFPSLIVLLYFDLYLWRNRNQIVSLN
jgi:hypothetical protein